MNDKDIERINYLYHKSKSEGLTPEEANEQKRLRADYIKAIRMSLRGTLDNIDVKEADGSITHLSEKHGKKKI